MKKTTVRQVLLDTKTACANLGGYDEIIEKAQALLKAIDAAPLAEDEIEKTFRSHQYRKLKYSRVSTYEESPDALMIPLSLSDKAARLLMVLERIAVRQEIQLSYKQVAQLLDTSEHSARRALAELTKSGILIKAVPARAHEATIYRLNACVYKVGKTLARPKDADALPYRIEEKEGPGEAPSVEKIAARERWTELKNAITVCKRDFNGETHAYIRLAF